jgi:hypothetical protein
MAIRDSRLFSHHAHLLRRRGWIPLFVMYGKTVWVGPKGELETQYNAQLRFQCAKCDKVLAQGSETERTECYECGQPACFYVFCYGDNEKTPETLMCGAHAAEHAADGSRIIRTPEHEEHMGYGPKEPTSG